MSETSVTFTIPAALPKQPEVEAFFTHILTYDQILIFSPHLDDTLLSMGGLLTELVKLRKDIINYNIYTECSSLSSDTTQLRLELAGVKDWKKYCVIRQAEDQQAFDQLGNVTVKNLGFIDSLWRHDDQEQPLYHTAFNPVHERDAHIEILREKIKSLITTPKTVAFCPLARGRHIDHVIVRDILASLDLDVIYYMDFPYSQKYAEENEFIAVNNLTSLQWPGPYEKKAELLLCYASQHRSLFTPSPFPLEYERYYFSNRPKY